MKSETFAGNSRTLLRSNIPPRSWRSSLLRIARRTSTDQIVGEFAGRGVRLHRQSERLGKTAAQNAAVEQATGEVILFSDATTLYQPDVLRVMMPDFADASVGCVAGRLVYVDPADSAVGHGARSYWSYETFLKTHESRIGPLIGASGCFTQFVATLMCRCITKPAAIS